MFRRSTGLFSRRIPSIRFTHGDRSVIDKELGLVSSSSSSTSGSTAGGSAQSFVSSNNSSAANASLKNLPSRFRPRPLGEEEMEAVRYGGNEINPIGWKPPKPVKGKK